MDNKRKLAAAIVDCCLREEKRKGREMWRRENEFKGIFVRCHEVSYSRWEGVESWSGWGILYIDGVAPIYCDYWCGEGWDEFIRPARIAKGWEEDML